MKILSHNKEAYEAVKSAFKTSKKTCVVQPTGTGKSYIALQLIENCKITDKILFVTSYDSVRGKFMKLLEKYLPDREIDCQVYMGLLGKELGNYDLIVLDEFHRVGAEKWGSTVDDIIKASPNAYIIGLSATPIRYLDDNRDMAEELFNGNVASEMTLAQAIARGILPLPKYVTCMYSLQDEYNNALIRVNKLKSSELRRKALSLLDRARGYLEKSRGLSEVFEEHIDNKSGRYLVFCKNREHLNEMLKESKTWFKGVNNKVNRYSIDSSMSYNTVHKVEQDFENDNSDALKLLFCIDMYNEGYHLEGLNGVILLRPTESINVYLQQIGRSLSTGGSSPLVIDVVRNIGCLNHCEILKNEVNTLFREGEEFDKEFTVYACMQEFMDLIAEALSLTSGVSFDDKVGLVASYIKETGDNRIVARVSYKGYSVGLFARQIRDAYSRGRLPKEYIDVLGALNFVWKANLNREDYYNLFAEYKKEFGHLDIKSSEMYKGHPLGTILGSLRHYYRNNELPNDYVKRLQELGVVLVSSRKAIDDWIELFEMYKQETGGLKISKSTVFRGSKIGVALGKLRTEHRKGNISEDKLAKIEALGLSLNSAYTCIHYTEKLQLFADYVKEFGHIKGIKRSEMYKGKPIGAYLAGCRSHYKSGVLMKELSEGLTKLDAEWFKTNKSKYADYEFVYNLLCDYKKENGNLNILREDIYKGEKIGSIVRTLRAKHRENKLDEDFVAKLSDLGFVWTPSKTTASLSKIYELFCRYYEINGNLIIGVDARIGDKDLYNYQKRLRKLNNNGSLSDEWKKKFDELGFRWEPVRKYKSKRDIE